MIELDWAKFEILNKKYANAFETLCLHLFSRYVHTECIVQILIRLDWRQNQLNIKGNSMASNLNISVRVWIINK